MSSKSLRLLSIEIRRSVRISTANISTSPVAKTFPHKGHLTLTFLPCRLDKSLKGRIKSFSIPNFSSGVSGITTLELQADNKKINVIIVS